MSYASDMLYALLDDGPYKGDDFFRMKATGNGSTNWFNVKPAELAAIASLLDTKSIFLLWDKGREEHGEAPTLSGVFSSEQAAEKAAQTIAERDWLDEEPDLGWEDFFSIEQKTVMT